MVATGRVVRLVAGGPHGEVAGVVRNGAKAARKTMRPTALASATALPSRRVTRQEGCDQTVHVLVIPRTEVQRVAPSAQVILRLEEQTGLHFLKQN